MGPVSRTQCISPEYKLVGDKDADQENRESRDMGGDQGRVADHYCRLNTPRPIPGKRNQDVQRGSQSYRGAAVVPRQVPEGGAGACGRPYQTEDQARRGSKGFIFIYSK